jgi:hypothetical protein
MKGVPLDWTIFELSDARQPAVKGSFVNAGTIRALLVLGGLNYNACVILVFGTICVDRVCRLAAMPETGGYVEALSEVRMLGGEAANTACALRSWGAEIVLAGNGIAEDDEGDFLRSELGRRGLEPIRDHLLPARQTPVCDGSDLARSERS